MGSSSAPRERMCSCTSPQSRRTATARSTKERPWSLICSRAPKAFRRQTFCAPRGENKPFKNPLAPSGRVFLIRIHDDAERSGHRAIGHTERGCRTISPRDSPRVSEILSLVIRKLRRGRHIHIRAAASVGGYRPLRYVKHFMPGTIHRLPLRYCFSRVVVKRLTDNPWDPLISLAGQGIERGDKAAFGFVVNMHVEQLRRAGIPICTRSKQGAHLAHLGRMAEDRKANCV